VILFVLKTHGALHFRAGVDKRAQRVAGQRVIVSAGIDVFKFSGFVVAGSESTPLKRKPSISFAALSV